MAFVDDDVSPSYYRGLAEELDLLARSVNDHPNLSAHFARRLHEIADQLRDDVRLMTLKGKVG